MEKEICRVIERALGLPDNSVNVNDSMETIQEWDSLGLLTILSALDERFGNRIAAIDEISSVRSVKGIIDILKNRSII